MPRNELFDKEEVINKALNIFWEKGYKGTSLSDLTNGLEIGKGSFYNSFKSKRALFELCIATYRAKSIQDLNQTLNQSKTPQKVLKQYLKNNLEKGGAINDFKGCFLTNTCAELANTDEIIASILENHYDEMRSIIRSYLRASTSWKSSQVQKISNLFVTFFLGMTVEVKLKKDTKRLHQNIDQLMNFIFD